jgi:hypothetical protein
MFPKSCALVFRARRCRDFSQWQPGTGHVVPSSSLRLGGRSPSLDTIRVSPDPRVAKPEAPCDSPLDLELLPYSLSNLIQSKSQRSWRSNEPPHKRQGAAKRLLRAGVAA